ncbi:hypothetical protein J1605_008616 [Eschrichtius robustus]|uniref:Uncharacterized protein n=1 Tax=Eschrichtius robustus TaxID=9764 RepID=A0AB34GZE1_ESCRO|nr:hypothetical protein J1605_008616 [Eschrichtius robustus]
MTIRGGDGSQGTAVRAGRVPRQGLQGFWTGRLEELEDCGPWLERVLPGGTYEGGDLSHEDGRLWREQRPRESSQGQRQKPRGRLKCGAERRHQGSKEWRPPSGRATGPVQAQGCPPSAKEVLVAPDPWHLGDEAAGEEAGSAGPLASAPPGEKPAGPLLPSLRTLQSVQRVAAPTAGILKDMEPQARLPKPGSSGLRGGTRASALNRVQLEGGRQSGKRPRQARSGAAAWPCPRERPAQRGPPVQRPHTPRLAGTLPAGPAERDLCGNGGITCLRSPQVLRLFSGDLPTQRPLESRLVAGLGSKDLGSLWCGQGLTRPENRGRLCAQETGLLAARSLLGLETPLPRSPAGAISLCTFSYPGSGSCLTCSW